MPVESIRLSGGGARSALWQQIQADIYGMPVELIEADEGAAYGAALLAGVGTGNWATVEAACETAVRGGEARAAGREDRAADGLTVCRIPEVVSSAESNRARQQVELPFA